MTHNTLATWRKSSYSSGGANCLEVATGRLVGVRDSKDPDGPALAFTPSQWRSFTRGVVNGRFDSDVR